jgi:two-component system response regulator GlrR
LTASLCWARFQALALSAPAPTWPDAAPEAWQQHIISRSRMAEALAEARLIAQSDASVLIRGESGTA